MNLNDNCIIFDTETTGLIPGSDEIIQLSIINGNNLVLFNEYIKPVKKTSWQKAEEINHISPSMVKDCMNFNFFKKQIQEIFDSVEIIIAYNAPFDIDFLSASGIDCTRIVQSAQLELFPDIPKREKKLILDPMKDFAPIYGEWSEYYQTYKNQNLTKAANYYGYRFKAHNALEDVKATLHVAKAIYKDR